MPILSIIVPVYNVAPYLREGLDSILQQDLSDIEIICINDGSTDDSLLILEEYASKDFRFIIIDNKKNLGVSKSRNIGIDKASGKYLVFFDPDDTIQKHMYSRLIKELEKSDVDMIMCGFTQIPDNKTIIPKFSTNSSTPYEFIKRNKKIHTSNDLCFPWRILYKRDYIILNRFRFIENIFMGSDTVFNFSTIMHAKKIVLLPEPLYNYRTNNPNSIVKRKYKPLLEESLQLQIAEKKRIIKEYHVDQYTPITKDMSEDIVKRYTAMLFNNLRNNPNEPDKIKGISRILSMPMITDAMKVIGYRNIYSSWKEYVFFLAMKWKWAKLVHKLYFK